MSGLRLPLRDITSCTAADLTNLLIGEYGPFVRLSDVWGKLGYPSLEAARKAAARNSAPMQVISLPGRRGKFVRTRDLATWLLLDSGSVDAPPNQQSGDQ